MSNRNPHNIELKLWTPEEDKLIIKYITSNSLQDIDSLITNNIIQDTTITELKLHVCALTKIWNISKNSEIEDYILLELA